MDVVELAKKVSLFVGLNDLTGLGEEYHNGRCIPKDQVKAKQDGVNFNIYVYQNRKGREVTVGELYEHHANEIRKNEEEIDRERHRQHQIDLDHLRHRQKVFEENEEILRNLATEEMSTRRELLDLGISDEEEGYLV